MSLSGESRKGYAVTRPDRGLALAPDRSVLRIMRTPVQTLQAGDPLKKAINLLGLASSRQSPVLKGDQLVGVICSCDLSRLVSGAFKDLLGGNGSDALEGLRIQELLAGGAVSIGPYHSIVTAAQVLLERRICALPVVEERQVVGLVTQVDLMRALVDLVKEMEGQRAAP